MYTYKHINLSIHIRSLQMRYTWVTAICLCAVVTAAVRRQMTLCGVTPIMPHFGTDLRGHRTDVHENIIGGEEAVPFSYPWMARCGILPECASACVCECVGVCESICV